MTQQSVAQQETRVSTAVVRVHTYSVDPSDLAEFMDRRGAVIELIRGAHPGLVSTQLVRREDGMYVDTWRWESMQAMAAAFPLAQSPEAGAAWALTADASALNGEVVDER